jgi:ribosome-binding protein aMBF1 (putative translation factor)
MNFKEFKMWKCQDCGKNPDNYKGKNDFICSRCTDSRVNFVAMLERETATELRKYKGKTTKKKQDGPLGIIRNRKEYEIAYHFWRIKQEKKEDLEKYSSVDLARARETRGLSLESLATFLGISKSYLCKIEKGQKPLPDNAIQFIKEGINFSEKSKKSLNTISRTGK